MTQTAEAENRPRSADSNANGSAQEADRWDQTPDFQLIQPATSYLDREKTPVLIGFPFSGSGAAMFAAWRPYLPASFSLVAASLPGREQRLQEQPWNDISAAAEQLSESLIRTVHENQPMIPVGFSNGALLAYEVTKRLITKGAQVPLMVVASKVSPTIETPKAGFSEMDDSTFVRFLADEFGAIPPEVAENQELLDLLLPALRGDLEMGEGYQYQPTGRLPCDVLAAHGAADEGVRLPWIADWSQVGQEFRARTFAGGHFFVREQAQAFLDTIAARYRAATNR